MLIFSAITPHTPLLLETISKDKVAKISKTLGALSNIADELYAAKPDTIIVISSHSPSADYDESFTVSLHEPYTIDLSEFGDLGKKQNFNPDLRLIDEIQDRIRIMGFSFSLDTAEKLYYGTAIPLLLLTAQIKNLKVVPIFVSSTDSKTCFNFGKELRNIILESNARIAVIASGDMSHTLTNDSPGGYATEGKIFDEKVLELITNDNKSGLITLDPNMVSGAQECAYKPLLVLEGVMDGSIYKSQIDSYEAPFGVGYLVSHFNLS